MCHLTGSCHVIRWGLSVDCVEDYNVMQLFCLFPMTVLVDQLDSY